MKVRAIVFDEPKEVSLREFELEKCGENEIIAEAHYSFVSPGTELRVFTGRQNGTSFPLIPGYSWVGRVFEVGKNVKGWKVGEPVSGRNAIPLSGVNSCWGGQASFHRCKPDHDVVKLPPGAELWDYVHAEVASISYRGVCSAYPLPGETAVVIGQGLIGAFNTKWLLLHGVRVIAVDIEEFRLDAAKKWGAVTILNSGDNDIRAEILSYCDGGADIVIESSGSLAGANLAATLLRVPSTQTVRTRYDVNMMHSNANVWPRLVFQASAYPSTQITPQGLQVVEGALILRPSDRSVADRIAVIEHIRKGDLPVADIISEPTPVEDAPSAYHFLLNNPDKARAVAFKWN